MVLAVAFFWTIWSIAEACVSALFVFSLFLRDTHTAEIASQVRSNRFSDLISEKASGQIVPEPTFS